MGVGLFGVDGEDWGGIIVYGIIYGVEGMGRVGGVFIRVFGMIMIVD